MPSKTDKHTPEPWHVGRGYEQSDPGHYVCGPSTGVVVCAQQDGTDCPLTEEDARRIVACVNACAGVTTEWLERNPGEVVHMGVNAHGQYRRQAAREALGAEPGGE